MPKRNSSSALVTDQSYSASEYSTFGYSDKNIQNLIVNKLYNELATENNNNQPLEISKCLPLGIESHSDDVVGPKMRSIQRIDVSDFQPNGIVPMKSNDVLFAENPGYGAVMPTQNDTSEEQFEQIKVLENEDKTNSTEIRILKNIDLLNFAKQIASGMVS